MSFPKNMNTWELKTQNKHEIVYNHSARTIIYGHEITNFLYQIKKINKDAKINYIAIGENGRLEIRFDIRSKIERKVI